MKSPGRKVLDREIRSAETLMYGVCESSDWYYKVVWAKCSKQGQRPLKFRGGREKDYLRVPFQLCNFDFKLMQIYGTVVYFIGGNGKVCEG